HWQEQPQVLRQFARHYQTGEPLPDDLLTRFIAARQFNQGFATVEFVSSALIDLEFHTQPASATHDVRAFERQELEKIGMPAEISLRSEEHTSELQSPCNLVCRLLLEKKKQTVLTY